VEGSPDWARGTRIDAAVFLDPALPGSGAPPLSEPFRAGAPALLGGGGGWCVIGANPGVPQQKLYTAQGGGTKRKSHLWWRRGCYRKGS